MENKRAQKTNSTNKKKINSKSGMILLLLLVSIVLIINLISASFSWFQPLIVNGGNVSLNEVAPMRVEGVENASIVTLKGTKSSDGAISYTTDVSTSHDQVIPSSSTNLVYYKTIIRNTNEDNSTDVSLFFTSFPGAGSNIKNGVSLGVRYPSSTFRTYNKNQSELPLIRNAYVKKYVKSDSMPGTLEVEWFVKNTSNTTVHLDITGLYLTYN